MPDIAPIDDTITLTRRDSIWVGRFKAMASPCEVLLSVDTRDLAEKLLKKAAGEAWRIEAKFSRYREDGILPRINRSQGKPVSVDPETAGLIDYAYQIFDLSDGLFDVTSGVLRKVWPFKASSVLPSEADVHALLPYIGLEKVTWEKPNITLPSDMQIDFGGIGKEYAVDRSMAILKAEADVPMMLNYGGDICCSQPSGYSIDWKVGIENSIEVLPLKSGGLATSGTTHRFLMHKGKRFSHVLNPKTGWPIENAPLSITVAADNCTQAGMIATLAMLQGSEAEAFLKVQKVFHRIIR